MRSELIIKIRNDPNLYRYLRENSYLYKYLNRDANYINVVEKQMRSRYRLTTQDKLKNINSRLSLIKDIMDIVK